MKVLTFSRTFPAYHPKAGTLTFFPEKISGSLILQNSLYMTKAEPHIQLVDKWFDSPKHHTIRAGKRWKVGDWFKPVVWGNDINPKSGRSGPYHSQQIQFAPPIQVTNTWDIRIRIIDFSPALGVQAVVTINGVNQTDIAKIASNDGLDEEDFLQWFMKKTDSEFEGQIICWDNKIEY
jgi:hypothetical protein